MPTVLSFTDAELRDISFALDLAVEEGAQYLRHYEGDEPGEYEENRDALERLESLALRFKTLAHRPSPDGLQSQIDILRSSLAAMSERLKRLES